MAQVLGGKKVTLMRHLEPGDKDYDEKEAKVEVTLEDGKTQTVKASEVKSSDPAPKPAPSDPAHSDETAPHPPGKSPMDDDEPKSSLGSRGRK